MSQHPRDNLDLFFAERFTGRTRRWHGFYTSYFPSITGQHSPSLVRAREVPKPEDKTTTEDSVYWGWEDADKPGKFAMIQPSWVQFTICFPYGPEASKEAGRGRVVALSVEEVLTADQVREAGLLERP